MSDKIYIFEEYKDAECYALRNESISIKEENTEKTDDFTRIMEDTGYGYKPKFVGFIKHINKNGNEIQEYVSFPKFMIPRRAIETGYNDLGLKPWAKDYEITERIYKSLKKEECIKTECKNAEEWIFKILMRYTDELTRNDPLFRECSELYGDYRDARLLLDDYNKTGPYYNEKQRLSYTKGRNTWSATIKKTKPDYINDVPIYTKVLRQSKKIEVSEISRIESGILNYCVQKGFFRVGDLKYDINSSFVLDIMDLEINRRKYYQRIIKNEIQKSFDENKINRLKILDKLLTLNYSSRDFEENRNEWTVVQKIVENNSKSSCCEDSYGHRKNYYKLEDFFEDKRNNKQNEICRVTFIKVPKGNKIESADNKENKKEDKKISNFNINIKCFEDCVSQTEIDIFLKRKSTHIFAVANFDIVLELLIGDYFGNGVRFGDNTHKKKNKYEFFNIPHLEFQSNLFSDGIRDMNEDDYRPGRYYLDETGNKPFLYPGNNERTDVSYCNYIDIAYDYAEDQQKYCVIIDAKNYGLRMIYKSDNENEYAERCYVQGMPKNEDIFKQYVYEDIMRSIYDKKETSVDGVYNVFMLPAIPDYDDKNKEIIPQDSLFKICGHHTDKYRKQSIFLVRVNMNMLIKEILDTKKDRVSDEKLQERRKKFRKLLEEYKNRMNGEKDETSRVYVSSFK